MNCPNDGTLLSQLSYEGDVEVDVCRQCRGIWLDHGELERIQETLEHDYSEDLKNIPDRAIKAYEMARQLGAGALERQCPRCARALRKEEYGFCSQIIIDVCSECRGVWLDTGELQSLEIFFERAREEAKAGAAGLMRGFFASLLTLFGKH